MRDHCQFPLQKFGRDATLVAAHQIGGNKPLRENRPRPMQHRSGGHRFLPVAGGAFIDPQARFEPPGLPPAAAGADKSTGASEALPGARYTAPRSQTAPRIPEVQPSDPTLPTGATLPWREVSNKNI